MHAGDFFFIYDGLTALWLDSKILARQIITHTG